MIKFKFDKNKVINVSQYSKIDPVTWLKFFKIN